MIYIKNNETSSGKVLYLADRTIIAPTHQQMLDAGWQVYEPPQPAEEEIAEMERQNRIAELKSLLTESDYKAIKYAEGWLSADEYASTKAQRQEWRDEINRLQEEEGGEP